MNQVNAMGRTGDAHLAAHGALQARRRVACFPSGHTRHPLPAVSSLTSYVTFSAIASLVDVRVEARVGKNLGIGFRHKSRQLVNGLAAPPLHRELS